MRKLRLFLWIFFKEADIMVSQKTRFDVFKRDDFTCQYCGRKSPEVILEVDHITPRSKGGSDDIGNLITSCRECNRGKSNIRLISEIPTPDPNKRSIAFHKLCEIGMKITENENELKRLYLRQKEAEINCFKADVEITQYKINTLTEESMINDPDYKGESIEEFTIKLYKRIGFLETRIMDKEYSDEVNIKLKLDLDMLYKNNTQLTTRDILKRVMDKDFQISPDAIDFILSTGNPEYTLTTLIKNIDDSIVMINKEAVKKFTFLN